MENIKQVAASGMASGKIPLAIPALSHKKGFTFRLSPSLFGWLLAAAGLLWVLHDLELGQLAQQLANIRWRWMLLAIAFDVLSYVSQGIRWRLLLKPVGNVSTLRSTQAIYAGLFTNELLPMRMGELVRAYLVSRWTAVKFVAVIPSMIVERCFDSLWMVVAIGCAALFVPLPPELLKAADVLGVIVVIAAALLFYVAVRQRNLAWLEQGQHSSRRSVRFVASLLTRLAEGLKGMGRTRAFYYSLAWSLILLVSQALAFWFVMLACDLPVSFPIGIAVFLIVHLGTAIPNAPANVGAFQFFTVLGLTLFGIDKATAAGFSIVVFLMLTLPLLLLGFVAISASGTSLLRIRRELQQMRASEV